MASDESRVVNLADFRRPDLGFLVIGGLPDDVVRIDRRSKWGNPFRIGARNCTHPDCGPETHPVATRESVIAAYRQWLLGMLRVQPDFLEPLRGKRLACWCAPLPCHGDVIAEFIP